MFLLVGRCSASWPRGWVAPPPSRPTVGAADRGRLRIAGRSRDGAVARQDIRRSDWWARPRWNRPARRAMLAGAPGDAAPPRPVRPSAFSASNWPPDRCAARVAVCARCACPCGAPAISSTSRYTWSASVDADAVFPRKLPHYGRDAVLALRCRLALRAARGGTHCRRGLGAAVIVSTPGGARWACALGTLCRLSLSQPRGWPPATCACSGKRQSHTDLHPVCRLPRARTAALSSREVDTHARCARSSPRVCRPGQGIETLQSASTKRRADRQMASLPAWSAPVERLTRRSCGTEAAFLWAQTPPPPRAPDSASRSTALTSIQSFGMNS